MRQLPKLFVFCALTISFVGINTHMLCGTEESKSAPIILELRSSDSAVHARAKIELLRPENLVGLSTYRAEILDSITSIESEEDAILLGALDLPPDRKQMVLASPQTPDKVRARLGDQKARDRVIVRLESAASLVEVRKAAADLLYVNDEAVLKVFAKLLESKQVFEDPHGNKVSIVLLLIQAFGQSHPEAKLFSSTNYLEHADLTGDQFHSASHQDYLREIERYLKDRYQLDVHLDPPLLLDTGKVGVYRKAITN